MVNIQQFEDFFTAQTFCRSPKFTDNNFCGQRLHKNQKVKVQKTPIMIDRIHNNNDCNNRYKCYNWAKVSTYCEKTECLKGI